MRERTGRHIRRFCSTAAEEQPPLFDQRFRAKVQFGDDGSWRGAAFQIGARGEVSPLRPFAREGQFREEKNDRLLPLGGLFLALFAPSAFVAEIVIVRTGLDLTLGQCMPLFEPLTE